MYAEHRGGHYILNKTHAAVIQPPIEQHSPLSKCVSCSPSLWKEISRLSELIVYLTVAHSLNNLSCLFTASIPSERDNEIDVHLSQSMQALEDLRSAAAYDVFIHYCDEDVSTDDLSRVHPATVVKDLQTAGFTWYA